MECLALPLFAMFFVAVLVFSFKKGQQHKDALRTLAERHPGLRVISGDKVEGIVGGVSVYVDTYSTGSGKSKTTWTRFRVADPESLNARSIGAEGLFSGMGKLLGGEDVQLGDPAADGKLLLRGSEAEILSRMDADARRIVVRSVTGGWEHEAGTWRVRRRGKMTNAKEMNAILARGFDVVKALHRSEDRNDALVQLATTDPLPSVRARAVEVRLATGGPLSSTEEELLIAQGGEVAVVVAQRMGMRGIPILQDAVQRADGFTRLRAAIALAKLDQGDVAVRSVLRASLDSETYQGVVIEALERVGTVEEVPVLSPIADAWMGSNKHAAKKAIRAIQSRISGAGVGQLSVAEATGGDLAVAEGQPDDAHERQRAARRAKAQLDGS